MKLDNVFSYYFADRTPMIDAAEIVGRSPWWGEIKARMDSVRRAVEHQARHGRRIFMLVRTQGVEVPHV